MNNKLRLRWHALLTTAVVSLAVYLASSFAPSAISRGEAAEAWPKYIFVFLADGGGITHMESARVFNRIVHDEGLVIADKIMKEGFVGLLTTHAANSLVTDSSAAATALACGCKAKNGAVGMCEDGKVPPTVMEIAKGQNMRVGLVTNSAVYDATPAAFAGHVTNRNLYSAILEQYLSLEPHLLMGGGRDQFIPRNHPGSRRRDDSDVIATFKSKGYAYVSDRQGLSGSKGGKVLGLFSLRDMSFDLDRDKDKEPSLSEMAQAAIRLLQEGNDRGFIVLIENENIDSAAHLLDAASVIHGYREFDRSVGLAYEFYKKHPADTLILVTSDHETGGMAFTGYPPFESLKKIASIRISLSKAVEILGPKPSADTVDQLVAEHFKDFVLAPEFKEAIIKRKPRGPTFWSNPTAAGLSAMVSAHTHIHWISSAHTNQPVFVAALGVGAERFRGYQDNTDFAKHLIALIERKNRAKP